MRYVLGEKIIIYVNIKFSQKNFTTYLAFKFSIELTFPFAPKIVLGFTWFLPFVRRTR